MRIGSLLNIISPEECANQRTSLQHAQALISLDCQFRSN